MTAPMQTWRLEQIRREVDGGNLVLPMSMGRDLLDEVDRLRARIEAAGDVVSDNGCECAREHSTLCEDHDEDLCVVCRVADALWPEVGR